MRLFNSISLKPLVTLLFVLLLTITLSSALFLQFRNELRIFERLSDRVTATHIESVGTHLFNFMEVPIQSNAAVEMVMREVLDAPKDTLEEFESPLKSTMEKIFPNMPQLSLIAFGSINGNYIAVDRGTENGNFRLLLKDARTHGVMNFYSGMSIQSPIINSVNHYDPRLRPWYRDVEINRQAVWTTAYWDLNKVRELTISYNSPVYDANRRYVGVVSSDIKIERFNQYLRSIPSLGNGVIFVLDGDNEMISYSSNDKLYNAPERGTLLHDKAKLRTPLDSTNPIIHTMAPYLVDRGLDKFTFTLNGEIFHARVAPFGASLGLKDWRIVVAVPRSDFIGRLDADRRTTIFLILGVFLVGITLAWVVLSKVTTPILDAARQAKLLARQEWSPSHESGFQLKEIRQLNNAFNEMSSRLSAAFSSLKHQVNYDPVSGLLSAEGLLEQMKALDFSGEKPKWRGLIMLSLDNISDVNNTLGYQKGEWLLGEFAASLNAIVPEGALLARVNDVEFAVCYPESHQGDILKDKIPKYVYLYTHSQGSEHLMFVGNIAFVDETFDDESLTEYLRKASLALVSARKKGTGAYEVYRPEMMTQAVENTRMLSELSQAQFNQELLVYFQPIVELRDGRVIGAEALIRWRSRAYGMVAPYVFIPLAEESGLILSIGRWVLKESCRQLALKISAGWPKDFMIHINVSARQLMQPDFYDSIVESLRESELSPCNLAIELTESILVEKGTIIGEQIAKIRALGLSVAIDDFGSGFSSLSYLYRLQFDCLKIDRDFVCGVLESGRSEAIVSAVVRLADGLSVPLVAEGIETEEAAAKLYHLGCKRGQGYYFGRPIPLDEWEKPEGDGKRG
ncbi:bifunctional diguanylate cyclase/phosphodiesterase [Leminorella grimontii]|uniref:bifunctional diguanylate cyclase/phosphodiesterase n=1 Tax=Leminorella grimontii TaxID=82981 RepID=UPI00321F76EF